MPRILVSLFCIAILSAAASATTIVASETSEVRYADPDAVITTSNLLVCNGGSSSSNHTKLYTKYDLSSLTEDVDTATLTLTVRGNDFSVEGDDVILIYGYTGSSTCSSSTVTWNNAPANVTNSAESFTSDGTLLGSFEMIHNGANIVAGTEFSISGSALVDFLNSYGDSDVTIMVSVQTATTLNPAGTYVRRAGFAGVGHTTYDPPKLDITTVPEPASLSVILLGLGGLLVKRCKNCY